MRLCLLLILTLPFFVTQARSQAIDGIVIDEDRLPIEGAQIFNVRTESHSHSNAQGRFRLTEVSIGDSIVTTFVGYGRSYQVVEVIGESLEIVLTSKAISLREVVISPRLQPLSIFREVDLQLAPVSSSQEVLRQVPGLFIGQHAGGGKAEQIFLRGFDIDHGTDIGISVDGMPVNMVSHAHGQGYADLHFVIPETVDRVDFAKGSYTADKGNFTTAGYVDFKTKKALKENLIKMEGGEFNSQRFLGMFKLLDKGNVDAYIASELISSDGPFESPQQFNRQNVMAQLDARLSQQDRFSAQVSHFNSSWNASGQIPERAVRTDSIGRFGAIDDTEGGTTSRSNVLVEHNRYVNERTVVKNLMYYSHYDFELFSNFTFFLNDPVNGDQILQQESRDMFGIKSQLGYSFDFGSNSGYLELGLELRNDKSIGNRLLRTLNRSIVLSSIQSGDIDERNAALYVDTDFEVGRWRFGAGLRFDHFNFGYTNDLQTFYSSEQERASVFSPKLKVSYQLSDNFQLYLGAGTGFHSNDTRVVIAQEAQEILPISYESDLGLIWKPIDRVVLNLAAWTLLLEQEFVYVGDEGVVEPSGRTRRQGLDFSMRYELYDKLFWTLDANYTYARTISEDSENNYIPLAPDLTSVSGLSWLSDKGIYGGLNVRYMDDRPANEDNSIVAEGYTVVDANIGYIWRACDFSIQVQNLLDTEWNETQFATESRLAYETQSVEEIHFTPGTPFFIKASLAIRF